MSDELIHRLRPLVTTFSAAIDVKYSHGDEIKVGGKIIRIFDLPSIIKNGNGMVQIEIDDAVGITTLMVPDMLLKDGEKLNIDDIVVAKGKVFKQGKSSKEEPYPTVYCWEVKVIEE